MSSIINVDLVATGEPAPAPAWQVEFPEGGNVEVTAGETDTIQWVLQTAPLTAAIHAVPIANGQPGDVPWAGPEPSAPDWTTTDHNSLTGGQSEVTWEYGVQVSYRGTVYSIDPQIKNKPPTIARRFRR